MKCGKAIEILELQIRLTSPNLEPDLIKANKLGIEALKLIQKLRGYSMTQVDTILPGEDAE